MILLVAMNEDNTSGPGALLQFSSCTSCASHIQLMTMAMPSGKMLFTWKKEVSHTASRMRKIYLTLLSITNVAAAMLHKIFMQYGIMAPDWVQLKYSTVRQVYHFIIQYECIDKLCEPQRGFDGSTSTFMCVHQCF